jgi:hypothetical protein
LLTHAIHFAVDDTIECSQPFVVHDKRFDLGVTRIPLRRTFAI